MTRFLCFDIDGTLLRCHGAGKAAIKTALESGYSLSHANVEVNYAGRTDASLCRELFELNGVEFTPQNIQAFKELYEKELSLELQKGGCELLPGVRELLDILSQDKRYRLGILTGNIKKTGFLKLQSHKLDSYFDFGGYGDSSEAREDIAKEAKLSAEELIGGSIDSQKILILGDTPKDVECGKAIGAKTLAVCTGYSPREEIEQTNPDLIVSDFSDVSKILGLIDGVFEEGE